MNSLNAQTAVTAGTSDASVVGFADRWYARNDFGISAIDSHAHVFVKGLPMARDRRHAPDYSATADDYVRHMAANHISHGVLVQPSFLGTDNSFLLAVLKRYPSKFRGVVVVDPSISEAQLQALAQLGVVGMRLNLIGVQMPDLTAARWTRFVQRLIDLDWHIEVHRQARDLPYLVGTLLRQGAKVVVDHFGRPDPQSGVDDPGFDYLLRQAHTGQVWVKLSAAYRTAQRPGDPSGLHFGQGATQKLIQAFSSSHLLWGSDWPHTQHQEVIDYAASKSALSAWVSDPVQRQIIMRSTAQKLFKFNH